MFLQDRRASSGLRAEVLVLVIVNIVNLMVNKMGTPVRNYLERIAAGLIKTPCFSWWVWLLWPKSLESCFV